MPGATPRAPRSSGIAAPGRCAAACSTCRTFRTARISSRDFTNSNPILELEQAASRSPARPAGWRSPALRAAAHGLAGRAVALAASTAARGGHRRSAPVSQPQRREPQCRAANWRRPRRVLRASARLPATSRPTNSRTSIAPCLSDCPCRATRWHRADDTVGTGRDQQCAYPPRAKRYLNAGGLGVLDRRRPASASGPGADPRKLLLGWRYSILRT